jgi:hypothetical protein
MSTKSNNNFKNKSKMKKTQLIFAAWAMLMLLFTACSKNDDSTDTNPQQQNPPTYEAQIVTPPDAMIESSDPGAQEAVGYVNMANAFTGMGSVFMVPPTKSTGYKSTNDDGPPWVYSWDVTEGEDNYTITLTVDETPVIYTWKVVIDGVMEAIVYNNFTFMESIQAKDGSNGSFIMYDPGKSNIVLSAIWTKDQNGVYTTTFEMPENMKIVMVSYPDESGEISVYDWGETDWILSFRAAWDNTGHGEWWEYEDGDISDQGSW